jgi:hypothetical protein
MIKKTLIAAALAFSSAPALAADLSYNYAQLSFLTLEDRGVDADGFGLKFSGLIAPTVYLVGGYSIVETDSFGPPANRSSVEIDTLSLGVGLRHPVDPKTEVHGDVSAIRAEADGKGGLAGFSDNDNGVGLTVGIRHRYSRELEASAAMEYASTGYADGTSLVLGGLYHANRQLSFGLNLGLGGPDIISLGARFNF